MTPAGWYGPCQPTAMGAHHRLGDLCLQCGRVDVVLTPQHETSQRQDPDADGLLTETQRATAVQSTARQYSSDSASSATRSSQPRRSCQACTTILPMPDAWTYSSA